MTVVALVTLFGCAVPSTTASNNTPNSQEFVSVNPGKSDWVERETATGLTKQYWHSMSNKEINDLLPLERNSVSILRVDTETSLGYAGARYTGSSGTYVVVLDYTKYRDELTDKEKIPCLVGIGIRVRATVTTKKSGLDLGSLFAIAYAAKSGHLTGNIEVIKIGIDSAQLRSAIPEFTEISDSSIQSAIQAIGAVKNRLYDNDTRLTPHVLAIQLAKKSQ